MKRHFKTLTCVPVAMADNGDNGDNGNGNGNGNGENGDLIERNVLFSFLIQFLTALDGLLDRKGSPGAGNL